MTSRRSSRAQVADEPQPVDLVVGGGVLGDIGVRVGDIGLRLVVVVVGDEVLHRVVGEELLELGAQLGGQGLVVGQHQGGPLDLFDDLGHGEGLAGPGDAQQDLLLEPVLDALRQSGDGLRLVPGGLIFRDNFKFRHGSRPSAQQTDFQSRPSYHTCHLFATFVRFFIKGTLPEKRKRKGQNGKGAWGKTSGLHRCGIAVPGPSGQRGDESPLYPSLLPLYTSSPLSAMDTKS